MSVVRQHGLYDFDLVIVGASIAGAALALALRDSGLRIAVLDQHEKFGPEKLTWGHDLQPNGLLALSRIDMLDTITALGARHEAWHAVEASGELIGTSYYQTLNHPFPYAVCVRPHVIRNTLRSALDGLSNVTLLIPSEFQSLRTSESAQVVTLECGGQVTDIRARLVVGADGPRSRVRTAAGIEASLKQYRRSWVDTIWRNPGSTVTDGYVHLGPGTYLGVVPTRDAEVVTFELTNARSRDEYIRRYGSANDLQSHYVGIAKILEDSLEPISSWDEMTWTPSVRLRASRWVGDGLALLGDSALTVNPITSQGVCLALQNAVGLAEVVRHAFDRDDLSRASLLPYQDWYKETAEVIQELGDLMAAVHSSKSSLVWALTRHFLESLESRPVLFEYVKGCLTGLHWTISEAPGVAEALRVSGLLPLARSRGFTAVRHWSA